MDSVTDNILSYYLDYLAQLRLEIDLLQPLLVQEDNNFLFVAFNPDVLQSLLNKYQQLFLMRTDKSRKIELSSASAQDKYPKLIMTSEDYNNISFKKNT